MSRDPLDFLDDGWEEPGHDGTWPMRCENDHEWGTRPGALGIGLEPATCPVCDMPGTPVED